jgi:hypothetical protein
MSTESISARSGESKIILHAVKGRPASIPIERILMALQEAGREGATLYDLAEQLGCSYAVVRHHLDPLLYSTPDKVGRRKESRHWRYFYEPDFKTELDHDYGDPSPSEYRLVHLFMRSYRNGARARGLTFELTHDEFRALVLADCHYCGAAPIRRVLRREAHYSYALICNGVDRPDTAGNYTLDNCVTACTVCNKIKMALTPDEFKEWVQRVYQHLAAA